MAPFYADRLQSPRVFSEGTLVYLIVPKSSETIENTGVFYISPVSLRVEEREGIAGGLSLVFHLGHSGDRDLPVIFCVGHGLDTDLPVLFYWDLILIGAVLECSKMHMTIPDGSLILREGSIDISPRYCGPYKILKRIGKVTCKLKLFPRLQVHVNIVIPRELVELEDLSYVPYELELIVDFRERQLRNKLIPEYLIEWKDRADEDSTWETVVS